MPPQLDQLVGSLVTIEPMASPVVSCYVDITPSKWKASIDEIRRRAADVRSGLSESAQRDFDISIDRILDRARNCVSKGKKSVALYCREGSHPFLSSIEFDALLENQLFADSLPRIYPLVALKDKLHRFVVVITSTAEARILEVVFGQVTESLITQRPDLRERIGREWTKEHFQSHKRDRKAQFLEGEGGNDRKVDAPEGI